MKKLQENYKPSLGEIVSEIGKENKERLSQIARPIVAGTKEFVSGTLDSLVGVYILPTSLRLVEEGEAKERKNYYHSIKIEDAWDPEYKDRYLDLKLKNGISRRQMTFIRSTGFIFGIVLIAGKIAGYIYVASLGHKEILAMPVIPLVTNVASGVYEKARRKGKEIKQKLIEKHAKEKLDALANNQ